MCHPPVFGLAGPKAGLFLLSRRAVWRVRGPQAGLFLPGMVGPLLAPRQVKCRSVLHVAAPDTGWTGSRHRATVTPSPFFCASFPVSPPDGQYNRAGPSLQMGALQVPSPRLFRSPVFSMSAPRGFASFISFLREVEEDSVLEIFTIRSCSSKSLRLLLQPPPSQPKFCSLVQLEQGVSGGRQQVRQPWPAGVSEQAPPTRRASGWLAPR